VQLGSFANADNAERLARELRGRGYKAYVSPSESKGPKRMRVRVGPEQDRARAEQLAKRLRRDGHPGTVVEQT
jgi:DedD protein